MDSEGYKMKRISDVRDCMVSVIEICIEDKGSHLYASSKDVPGLYLAGQTPEELLEKIIPAVKLLFKLNRDIDVEVLPAIEPALFPQRPTAALRAPVSKFVLSAQDNFAAACAQ